VNKLTVEIEYDRGAFADHQQALCKVSVKRENGALLWEAHYDQINFGQPLEVVAVAANDLVDAHGKIL
jgi:hypothetical protein